MTWVTVVIPLFNKEKYIQRTLHSVFNQTHDLFEIVIINDGSTDNSLARVSELHDPRIRIINQENLGVSAARNRGVKEAKYDLIAFLDADDEWAQNFLAEVISLAKKFKDCGMYASGYCTEHEDGHIENRSSKFFPENFRGIVEDYFEVIKHGTFLHSSSVMFRKNEFLSLGGFAAGILRFEDYDMWIRVFLKSGIAFFNSPLCMYRHDPGYKLYYQIDVEEEAYHVMRLRSYIQNGLVRREFLESAYDFVAHANVPIARTLFQKGKVTDAFRILWVSRHSKRHLWKMLKIGAKSFLRWAFF